MDCVSGLIVRTCTLARRFGCCCGRRIKLSRWQNAVFVIPVDYSNVLRLLPGLRWPHIRLQLALDPFAAHAALDRRPHP